MELFLPQRKLILSDIDNYSSELNIHKEFVINNVKKTYFLLTWYFNSTNEQEYFKAFINNILECFGPESIEEITSTVEKSSTLHIHCVIMFKRTACIYKINKYYKDINIEAVNCSEYENIKIYCSKEFTKVKSIECIVWNNYNLILNNLKIDDKNIKDKIYIKILIKKIHDMFSNGIRRFEKKMLEKGILINESDYIEELYCYYKSGESNFLSANYIPDEKIKELNNTIIMLNLNIIDLKNKNSELQNTNNELISKVYNLTKTNTKTLDLDLVFEENKLLKLQISKIKEELNECNNKNTERIKFNDNKIKSINKEFKSNESLVKKYADLQLLYFSVCDRVEQLNLKISRYRKIVLFDNKNDVSHTTSEYSNTKYENLLEKYENVLDKNTSDRIKYNDMIDILGVKYDNIIDNLKSNHFDTINTIELLIEKLKMKHIDDINNKEIYIEQLKTKHLDDINNKEIVIENLKSKYYNIK